MSQILIQGDMLGDNIFVEDELREKAKNLYFKIKKSEKKFVIAIAGGSGSGKSVISALLGTELIRNGKKTYVLSCDNYPFLPPRDNEAKREKLFLQGENLLRDYLGTKQEIDFSRLAKIVENFHLGAKTIYLRIIDNPGNKIYEEKKPIDVSNTEILILEGTWSHLIEGVDLRIFLDSNYQNTAENRKKRARDPITEIDEKVLLFEQQKLEKIKERADIIC